MAEDLPKKRAERKDTDESLRAERQKVDAELSEKQRQIEGDANAIVDEARTKADAVLSDARVREDLKLEADGPPKNVAAILGTERAVEDAAVDAERRMADEALTSERARRELARSRLLAAERKETDLRLEIERARSDEALTSREDFLAMASHDLRSLLNGIVLNASMLKRLANPAQRDDIAARHANSIERFCGRMDRLIGDLIDVASLEAGKLAIQRERKDAVMVARESAEALQPLAAVTGIELACEPEDATVPAEFDYERIVQVLTNLVGNAFKFSKKGTRVVISVAKRGADVLFSVTDTGEGIDNDKLEQIFQRFFQTRRQDRRGLGLGLYIAKSIVDAHGGRIWAESVPGRGSTFFFTLPLHPSD